MEIHLLIKILCFICGIFLFLPSNVFATPLYGFDNSSDQGAIDRQQIPLQHFQNSEMMFRFNAQHTGDYSSIAGNVAPNNLTKWKFSANGNVFSSPAIANDVVYIGSEDKNIYAINAHLGTRIWKYQTNDNVSATPSIANGIVYVGSVDKNIYALSAENGEFIWKYLTDGPIYDSSIVANGIVYTGSSDGNIYALNAETGVLIWKYPTDDYWAISDSPALANGVIYVGSCNGNIYAISAKTRLPVWNRTISTAGYCIDSTPVVSNGFVYISSNEGTFYALNAETGAIIWKYPTNAFLRSSPAISGDKIFLTNWGGNIYSLNAKSGDLIWKKTVDDFGLTSPALANSILYIGGNSPKGIKKITVYALNADTGAIIWEYSTENDISSEPIISNGVLYVASWDGNIYAIGNQTPSGTLTETTVPTPILSRNQTTTPTPISSQIKKPVLIVHGLEDTNESVEAKSLFTELKKNRMVYAIEYFDGPGNAYGDIRDYAHTLDSAITKIKKETNSEKVDIVAHSMGGLIARYRIEKIRDDDVGKLIMIGTPNHGSDFSRDSLLRVIKNILCDPDYMLFQFHLFYNEYYKENKNQAINEMQPRSDFLFELNGNRATEIEVTRGGVIDTISNKVNYSIIAGNRIPTMSFHVKDLFVDGDGFVAFDSAKLSNVAIYPVPGFHFGQFEIPEIINKVQELLEQPDNPNFAEQRD